MKKAMWIICVLTAVVTFLAIQLMPETVPMHWNLDGNVDRYGSRYENLILPAVIFAITLFQELIILCFEKSARSAATEKEQKDALVNVKVIKIAGLATTAFMSILQLAILFVTAKSDLVNVSALLGKFIPALMGVFIIVIGNYLPKTKRNGVIGIRIKWSMYNDTTWMKSNRFCGEIYIVTGIILFFTALFADPVISLTLIPVSMLIATIIACIYSRKIYMEEINKVGNNG